MAPNAETRSPFLLITAGVLVVYSVVVLGYVATHGDLRIRALITDAEDSVNGIPISPVAGVDTLWPEGEDDREIEPGTRLVGLGSHSVETFPDFAIALRTISTTEIRQPEYAADGFEDLNAFLNRGLIRHRVTGDRWVRVQMTDPAGKPRTAWMRVQSLPFSDLVLSLVWFVLQMTILAAGGVAYWHRPFDRAARQFFILAVVTLAAYIGGFHWWVISSSVLLMLPFVCCAVLVPVAVLHFFLTWPTVATSVVERPRTLRLALYSGAWLQMGFLLVAILGERGRRLAGAGPTELRDWNNALGMGVLGSLILGVAFFVAAIFVLARSARVCKNPIERAQVRWVLTAASVALIPIAYVLFLALQPARPGFALAETGVPMFLASFAFMVAFVVSMARYRMLLLDQIITKGGLYYTVSVGVTISFALLLAFASLLSDSFSIGRTPLHWFAWICVLTVGAGLVLWSRDQIQDAIDRRFFREKYQLDRALQRVNQAMESQVSIESAAEMLLTSCQDAIESAGVAIYLEKPSGGSLQLVAADWPHDLPIQLTLADPLINELRDRGTVQRTQSPARDSQVQLFLRGLQADLVQTLESEEHLSGLIVLSAKRGGGFSAEDLTFLAALSQITNVAFHSARLHRDMGGLNEELRHKTELIDEQKRQIRTLQRELMTRLEPTPARDRQPKPEFRREAIKGHGPAISEVLQSVKKVAGSNATVLIRGENGTGKELLAQTIHDNSHRRHRQIIKVNCAALAPTLLESELFGHVKGAFTGAGADKPGRFQAADGGTLFLDEIGDLPLDIQVKLLRVLQERAFEPVGSDSTVQVDIRLITATNRNLEQLIEEGKFRQDLFYRLDVIRLSLPPLRGRIEDLWELSLHFLTVASNNSGKAIVGIEDDAFAALEQHSWPGNIRELQNVIERAVVLSESDRITLEDLPPEFVETAPLARKVAASSVAVSAANPRPTTIVEADTEMKQLLRALEEADQNKAEAARRLGMPRSTFYSKLKKYGIAASGPVPPKG